MLGFLRNSKVFLISFLIINLWAIDKVFATSDPAMDRLEAAGAGLGGGDGAFSYNKEKFEGYYNTSGHEIYRSLGANSWPVVHGIAARRIPPKEGELSSDAFHAGGLSPKELDEWFRRGLLPSIIFVLTGVVRDEKYAVKSIHEGWNPHSAARVFYVTFISGKHLGYAFTTDLKDKMTANVFGEGGLKGWVDPEYKEFKGIFSPFVFKDATFTQGFPEQLNQFPVRDGEEHTLLTPFYRDSTPQRVAENIDQKVRPLFETLGRDETLLEIARHFHQYKLKEERLENERDFDSSFAKLDPERKDDYKTRSTDTSQITNALQYYVFKYIQETISQALGRIRAVTCLHDSDFSALMDLVRRENPPAAE